MTKPADCIIAASLTTMQLAAAFNVSERMIYMARKLIRSGRTDLCLKVEAGEMTVTEALRIIEAKAKPTKLKRMFSLWIAASESERAAFLDAIKNRRGDQGGEHTNTP